jgi:S-adenosylhomocysteine hydrolase
MTVLFDVIMLIIGHFAYLSDVRRLRKVAYDWINNPDQLNEYDIQNVVNQIDLSA